MTACLNRLALCLGSARAAEAEQLLKEAVPLGRRQMGRVVDPDRSQALVCVESLAAEKIPWLFSTLVVSRKYLDENRDLVADPPKDPAKLVSPEPLIFTYAPVEDPAVTTGDFHTTINPIPLSELQGRGGSFTTTCSN